MSLREARIDNCSGKESIGRHANTRECRVSLDNIVKTAHRTHQTHRTHHQPSNDRQIVNTNFEKYETMAYLLPHLRSGWEVDQAIMTEEDRVVVVRFGRDQDPTCMVQDEVLMSIAEKVKNFAVVYLVDLDEVPDFNDMYELYDPCTTMFFYRNKHIMVDLGTGNNNKINWALADKQELIDIIEVVYRGARKGRGLVVSPKDYSTKYRY